MDAARRTTYVFVDAGHVREHGPSRLEQIYGERREIDYGLIRRHEEAERVFVFDSLPTVKKASENEEQFRQAYADADLRLRSVGALPFVHVRVGTLVGDGKRRRQKGVDVALAVEALTHAFRRNMEHAIIVAKDRDYEPLLHALVDAGTYVTLIGHDPPEELRLAADVYEPLDAVRLTAYAYAKQERNENPRLVRLAHFTEWNSQRKGTGTCGDAQVQLRSLRNQPQRFWIGTDMFGEFGFASAELPVVVRALEDHFGPIEWDEAATTLIASPPP